MRNLALAVVIIVCALALCACGGDGSEIEGDDGCIGYIHAVVCSPNGACYDNVICVREGDAR